MKQFASHAKAFYPLYLTFLLLTACGQEGSSPSVGGADNVLVTLSFRLPEVRKASLISKPALTNVDSIEITVTGEGMVEIKETLNIQAGEEVSLILEIPVGPARIFEAIVFDLPGNAIYGGQSQPTDILSSETARVSILLKALLLNISSELPKLSENYLMLDVLGIPPFVKPANSAVYSSTVGIPSLKGTESTSQNYTLR